MATATARPSAGRGAPGGMRDGHYLRAPPAAVPGVAGGGRLLREHGTAAPAAPAAPARPAGGNAAALCRRHLGPSVPRDGRRPGRHAGPVRAHRGVPAAPVRGLGHAAFRRESLLNTPLFAGFPGFVSKLWLANDDLGRYRGLYEWDDPLPAENLARALWRVLALVSVPGSIHYVVLPGAAPGRGARPAAPAGRGRVLVAADRRRLRPPRSSPPPTSWWRRRPGRAGPGPAGARPRRGGPGRRPAARGRSGLRARSSCTPARWRCCARSG